MPDVASIGLRSGTIIAGKYEIIKCLGSGSMGVVYSARIIGSDDTKIYALKVLYPEVAKNPALAARFRNEVLVAYGVNHPNVVRAYEYIRDGDIIAYSMEFLDGGDLADRLANYHDQPIPFELGLKWLWQMASGLQAIHEAGIIHRDLKPENILLAGGDNIKIVDFGIAKAQHGPKLTEHGGVVGTLNYVSPEYIISGNIDKRSDIYAYGLLAYEIFTGSQPFNQGSMLDMMTTRIKMDPPNPKTINPRIPDRLAELILKCLKRNPDERYQNMEEILVDLVSIFEKENITISDLSRITSATEAKLAKNTIPVLKRENFVTERDPYAFRTDNQFDPETQINVFKSQEVDKSRIRLEKVLETSVQETKQTDYFSANRLVFMILCLMGILSGLAMGRLLVLFLGWM
ncbi:MAG: serine/threonine protein kinase [Deltaproteobacteria bacterium]|nr:serine/threonine protein kinase [Deltaproteobacteria bacterium]